MDDYRYLAQRFREETEIGPEYRDLDHAVQGHWRVAKEEFDELDVEVENLIRAYELSQGEQVGISSEQYNGLAEEMADVLVTIHVLADMLGIDIEKAYQKKMMYNLEKSSDKDENGKVTDDGEAEKPDFGDTHNEQ